MRFDTARLTDIAKIHQFFEKHAKASLFSYDIIRALEFCLPSGFDSWSQVLTTWVTQRVYRRVRGPKVFIGEPCLGAPFVSAVAAVVHRKLVLRRATALRIQQVSMVETMHEEMGGSTYSVLHSAREIAQNKYMRLYCSQRRGEPVDESHLDALQAEMVLAQAALDRLRATHEQAIREAHRKLACAYWEQFHANLMPDTFFSHAPLTSPVARMSRVHAPWWGKFFGALQKGFAVRDPMHGELLDALPMLHHIATIKTVEAMVSEWIEARADEWGQAGIANHRVFAGRTQDKAEQVVDWFDAVAPRYRQDTLVRRFLDERLQECLGKEDPWEPLPHGIPRIFQAGHWHGRN